MVWASRVSSRTEGELLSRRDDGGERGQSQAPKVKVQIKAKKVQVKCAGGCRRYAWGVFTRAFGRVGKRSRTTGCVGDDRA